MAYRVQVPDDAARDLEEICDYITRHDSPAQANYVLDRIESAFQALAESPRYGRFPTELLDIGIREYREVFFKRYRILYRVIEETIYLFIIADGRRDMQSLLQRRLLHA